MTQRRPNPYFIRASATSSQGMHALADYAAKELKFKRIITLADDFAFGHEQMAGFQRVFEDAGGKIVKKLWPPLTTPTTRRTSRRSAGPMRSCSGSRDRTRLSLLNSTGQPAGR